MKHMDFLNIIIEYENHLFLPSNYAKTSILFFQIAAEALSCRNAAAMFDLSSFCKILIEGSDAKNALSWICTNDIDGLPKS